MVKWLLDTNVLSEARKSRHRIEPAVRSWISSKKPSSLYLSSITILEVDIGIWRLSARDPQQSERLRHWLEEDVLEVFAERIVPVDVEVVRCAAPMHVPESRPDRDALIAATALVKGMTLATRNIRDFASMGVPLVNPWYHDAASGSSLT